MNPPRNRKSVAGNPPPTVRAPVLDPTNSSLKVDFQGSRLTSDGGLVLVRKLDERLSLSEIVDRHLGDSRRGKNI